MFQVNPTRVMYALGLPREPEASQPTETSDDAEANAEEAEPEAEAAEPVEVDVDREPKEVIKDLLTQAKIILDVDKDRIGGKRKQELRAFSQAVRKLISRSGRETVMTDSLEAQFQEIQNQLQIRGETTDQKSTQKPARSETQVESSQVKIPSKEMNFLSASDLDIFKHALRTMQEDGKVSAMGVAMDAPKLHVRLCFHSSISRGQP